MLTRFHLLLNFDFTHLGFTVFAGVLFPDGDGARELVRTCSPKLRVLRMDVTKVDDIECVVNAIRISGQHLYAIVNNAGIGFGAFADLGKLDLDDYRRVLDVNLLGVIRVTRACIPLLRETRGRIVNVESLAGKK